MITEKDIEKVLKEVPEYVKEKEEFTLIIVKYDDFPHKDCTHLNRRLLLNGMLLIRDVEKIYDVIAVKKEKLYEVIDYIRGYAKHRGCKVISITFLDDKGVEPRD